MQKVTITVKNHLPPRKDSEGFSPWGPKGDTERLVVLRRAAAAAMVESNQEILAGRVRLSLTIHTSEAAGDLFNFLDGIADGLQSKPRGMADRYIADVFLQGDSVDAHKSLVYHNDGQVDEITAVRRPASGNSWYTITVEPESAK